MMLGNLAGTMVLDLGCGEGGYARELARRGAHVVGIDGGERLVTIAIERARSERLNVRFLHANASAMNGIHSESFDFVIAAISLDLEDYAGAIPETYRVCRLAES